MSWLLPAQISIRVHVEGVVPCRTGRQYTVKRRRLAVLLFPLFCKLPLTISIIFLKMRSHPSRVVIKDRPSIRLPSSYLYV